MGRCPAAGRRCQALVSMASPQGPADGSLPTGDPSPSEGTPGPSRAPASPAATRRRALLQELETQVQAAYGQVRGLGYGAILNWGTVRGQWGRHTPTGARWTNPGLSPGRGPQRCTVTEGSAVTQLPRREAGIPPHLCPH